MRKQIAVLALTFGTLASAQLLVTDPKACSESDMGASFSVEEAPVGVKLNTNAGCIGGNDSGTIIRVWKYKHRQQRIAAPKEWKLSLDNGDGKPTTFKIPHSSIVGVYLHQKDSDGKWKAYRGGSKNPIALTQAPLLLTLRKATETKAGGLKQEHLVWDILSIDTLPFKGADLRIEQVWIWQGLNPIAKKVVTGTSKTKLTFQTE